MQRPVHSGLHSHTQKHTHTHTGNSNAKIMIDKLDSGESDLEFLKRITGKNDTLAQ